MKIYPIASSSSGNCTILDFGDSVILIDCGITLTMLKQHVKDLSRIKATFITHEHGDHVAGVGPLSRKINAPFYVNSLSAKKKPYVFEDCKNLQDLVAGSEIEIEGLARIMPFTTKHDSAYSVGFVVTALASSKKFGYLTDTGFITPMMADILKGCSGLFIEADYDEELLAQYEGYPEELKDRITSNFGHLGTKQVLTFIKERYDVNTLDFVILGHMSSRTNSVDQLAIRLEEFFPETLDKFHIAPIEEGIEFDE